MTNSAAYVPNHVGIILDGNRRWAKERGLLSIKGHRQGSKQIEPVAKAAWQAGVKFLSLFVFSVDNWSRSQIEVDYLMKLFLRMAKKDNRRLVEEGYRIKFAGRRCDKISPEMLKLINKLEDDSCNNTGLTVVFYFNYDGLEEIADAVSNIINSDQGPTANYQRSCFEQFVSPRCP